jgi:hypothetical protein
VTLTVRVDCLCAQVERGIHGLEPSVVASCPTVKLDDGAPGREESQLRFQFFLLFFSACSSAHLGADPVTSGTMRPSRSTAHARPLQQEN